MQRFLSSISIVLLLLASIVALAAGQASDSGSSSSLSPIAAIRPHTPIAHAEWTMHSQRPEPDDTALLTFVLAKQKMQQLEDTLLRVSDPTHADYGKHLSRDEVRAMVQPDAAVVAQWHAWAEAQTASSGASFNWNAERDILHLRLPVAQMESLLGHELRRYSHPKGSTCIRASVSSSELLSAASGPLSSLSPALRRSVSYISGVTRFPLASMETRGNSRRSPLLAKIAADAKPVRTVATDASRAVPLSTITSLSDYPNEQQTLSNIHLFGGDASFRGGMIVACMCSAAPVAWSLPMQMGGVWGCMQSGQHLPFYSLTVSLTSGANSTSYEVLASDHPLIDLPNGLPGVAGVFPLPSNYDAWSVSFAFNWVANTGGASYSLQTSFAYPLTLRGSTMIHPLTVRQVYGVPNIVPFTVQGPTRARTRMGIVALDLGGDNRGYYSLSDLDSFYDANRIDELNAQAVTFVDSADPPTPLDQSQPDDETTLDIVCTTGANPYTGLSVLHSPRSSSTQFEDVLNLALADPTISVVSISYVADEDETDVESINSLFVQLGSVGVSVFVAAGDTGPFLTRNQTTQCDAFAPRFPASSPWVTSVGGSMLSRSSFGACPTETVSSMDGGAIITGGGGFSNLAAHAQPLYQRSAVNQWMAFASCPKPQIYAFNSSSRAYPDVSMLAHAYSIVLGGQTIQLDGTSASSPVLAGIIGAYNLLRVENNMPRLGWINPLLYQTFNSTPAAFNDITSGDNRCLEPDAGRCCIEGYTACPGFDPASGLGSINWRVFGPLVAPGLVTHFNVSNYFLPDCPGFAVWPGGPSTGGGGDGSKPNRSVATAIGISFLLVIVVAAVTFGGVRTWRKQKRRAADRSIDSLDSNAAELEGSSYAQMRGHIDDEGGI